MNFFNGELIVYNKDNAFILNVDELLTKFNSEQISEFEFELKDDVYIDTFSNPDKIELDKIQKVVIDNNSDLDYVYLNDEGNFVSNIICFNNKNNKFIPEQVSNIEKKFVPVNNSYFASKNLTFLNDIHLDMTFGYLIGYWLLRGGVFKLDKNNKEHLSWSGREEDIAKLNNLVKEQTTVTKHFKNNIQLFLIIDEIYFSFFKDNFFLNKEKVLPSWILMPKSEFLQGLFYGLIASNSYISTDSKNNFYLAIKIKNPSLILKIQKIFKIRFGIHSRVIGDNDHLSFKINKRIHDFITIGIDKKYISIPEFENVVPIMNKEIVFKKFKIVPWYKFKTNTKYNRTIDKSYSLKLEKNNTIMLSNGIFTNV